MIIESHCLHSLISSNFLHHSELLPFEGVSIFLVSHEVHGVFRCIETRLWIYSQLTCDREIERVGAGKELERVASNLLEEHRASIFCISRDEHVLHISSHWQGIDVVDAMVGLVDEDRIIGSHRISWHDTILAVLCFQCNIIYEIAEREAGDGSIIVECYLGIVIIETWRHRAYCNHKECESDYFRSHFIWFRFLFSTLLLVILRAFPYSVLHIKHARENFRLQNYS